ncbi:hypothetical protein BV22DRAFT_1028333 [Leucogyrophana mollusca]|uniref:Uncharacterized protein n=1 Tax=Leucogyrophana mollusca TaxID=85980 RepID=A0ACB8BWT1_9AGAM|nr:hypothetical protein BV22DRAFT_1028333 [Leucogyrophana mollusca]
MSVLKSIIGASCNSARVLEGLLLVIMMATEGLLLLRTLALWHGNKKVRVALLSVYSMLFLAVIVVGGVTVTFHVVVPAPSYCLSTAINPYATGIFSGIMFFELMVLWLTIYYEVRLRSAGLTPIGQLAIALARGNMLYALSLFLMSLANVIVFALPVNLGVSELFDVFQAVIHSIMASRILFKLRKAGTNDDTELSPLSDLRFESGETFSSPPLSPSE